MINTAYLYYNTSFDTLQKRPRLVSPEKKIFQREVRIFIIIRIKHVKHFLFLFIEFILFWISINI